MQSNFQYAKRFVEYKGVNQMSEQLEDSEVFYVASEMIGMAVELLQARGDLEAAPSTMVLLMEAKAMLKVYSMYCQVNEPPCPTDHEGTDLHPF